jgi:D-serine deaminase-like pyridoxal phosphate-dependent protein
MRVMARVRWLAVGVALAFGVGCVSDPKVEINVQPARGITEPASDAGASLIGAAAACDALVTAAGDANRRLGCSTSSAPFTCPQYTYLAGAQACTEYRAGTVAACVAAMAKYKACSDFDTKPCVSTVVATSCAVPAKVSADAGKDSTVSGPLLDAGAHGEAGQGTDPGPGADAGSSDAGLTDAGPG